MAANSSWTTNEKWPHNPFTRRVTPRPHAVTECRFTTFQHRGSSTGDAARATQSAYEQKNTLIQKITTQITQLKNLITTAVLSPAWRTEADVLLRKANFAVKEAMEDAKRFVHLHANLDITNDVAFVFHDYHDLAANKAAIIRYLNVLSQLPSQMIITLICVRDANRPPILFEAVQSMFRVMNVKFTADGSADGFFGFIHVYFTSEHAAAQSSTQRLLEPFQVRTSEPPISVKSSQSNIRNLTIARGAPQAACKTTSRYINQLDELLSSSTLSQSQRAIAHGLRTKTSVLDNDIDIIHFRSNHHFTNAFIFDFHGSHVAYAQAKGITYLNVLAQLPAQMNVTLICGKGNHSESGKPLIFNATQALFKEMNVPASVDGNGNITIYFTSGMPRNA